MARGFGGRGFGGHTHYGGYTHHYGGYAHHGSAFGGIGRIIEHAIIYSAIGHLIGSLFRGHSFFGSLVIVAVLIGAVVLVSRVLRRRRYS